MHTLGRPSSPSAIWVSVIPQDPPGELHSVTALQAAPLRTTHFGQRVAHPRERCPQERDGRTRCDVHRTNLLHASMNARTLRIAEDSVRPMLPALTEAVGSCKHESGHDGVDASTAAVGVTHALGRRNCCGCSPANKQVAASRFRANVPRGLGRLRARRRGRRRLPHSPGKPGIGCARAETAASR
jgi:hypothetical protein